MTEPYHRNLNTKCRGRPGQVLGNTAFHLHRFLHKLQHDLPQRQTVVECRSSSITFYRALPVTILHLNL